jgi:competence protein ComEC
MTAFYLLLIALGFILDDWRQPMKDRPLAKQKRRLWFGVSTCIIMYFLINMLPIHLRGNSSAGLSLTAIDVGQGSAILVRFPGGGKMLVDGGGFYDESFDIGRSVVAPYLWHQRINRIETVVLTHSHPDHLQGLLFIVQHFGVRQVWTNGDVCDSPLYQKFLQITSSRGLPIDTINDSTPPMNIEGVSIQVLNPRSLWAQGNSIMIPPSHRETGLSLEEKRPHSTKRDTGKRTMEDCNDRSLVIKLTYRNRSFLLPADITSITENRLLYSGADLKSDVLLVPHHGSGHSSTEPFIRLVAPLLGIISCGRDNIHGLPHPEVIQRYRQINTKIFRTDRDGAVTVETDGKELKLSTFKIPFR